MTYLGDFATGKTIFFPFQTFNAAGASVTLTGLAVTDIEVYKGASMTQRASDAGYALVDTDGIDLDGITGIHGFTIDTSDNTDAGFYAAGNDYTVVVSAVTVDAQTVNFIAGRFSIDNRSTAAIKTKTDFLPSATAGATGGLFIAGTNAATTVTTSFTTTFTGNLTGSVGSATALGANAITAAATAADFTTEIQTGLATAAALSAVAGYLDTEIAAILALLDDPRGEPGQGTPPVNPDLATKIDYLYKHFRNRKTQTADTFSLYNDDATTVGQKATVADDGTTFSITELISGA